MSTQTTGTLKNKIIKCVSALLISILICVTLPFNALAIQTGSIYTSSKYNHNTRFDNNTIVHGIDISVHNGTIDWDELEESETKVVIIRVGCRGYGSAGTLIKDNNFESNMANAIAHGFEVGVYFYSQALDEEEAEEEANYVLKYIKSYNFTLPVYYDYEFAGVSSGRLDKAWKNKDIDKAQMTDNALAFCSTIENAGYRAGIYASKSFFETQLNRTQLEDKYSIWLAHYNTSTTYAGLYQMWQYSSKGKVEGISGYVDSNFIYYELLSAFAKGQSSVVPEQPIDPALLPQAVTNLQLTGRETDSLSVSWQSAYNAEKYLVQVYRSDKWVKAGETSSTNFTVKGLTTASNYKIRVCGVKKLNNKDYSGAFSNEIETATMPAVPTEITASEVKPNSLKLKWKKQTNVSYYEVYKYNPNTKEYEFFSKIKNGKNNFLAVSELSPNKTYKFKVKAYKNSKDGELLESEQSKAAAVYTAPVAATISSVKSSAVKKITTKWKKSSGVSGYQIMWSTTKNFSSNYKSVTSTSTKTTLSTAQSKKTYYVRVRSYKTRGSKKIYSPWSKTLSVKTK